MSDIRPLVSIILPTYNRAHVLPLAIKSILGQTYTNLELIIVDDNSNDNTAEIVQSFDDERIHYYKNDPNLKLPRALNRGFSLAKGDYLTWTSDDNIFAENAIDKMVDRLSQGDYQFVYADYYLFSDLDENNHPVNVRHERLPSKTQLEKSNHIGACFMYTRKAHQEVGEYDPELFLVEDYDYFIRIDKRFGMCHIAEPLYYFRRNDETLYYSRYCEVKASDVLIRYKNELISQAEVIGVVIGLIMQNFEGVKNPLWKFIYRLIKPSSYRLTNSFRKYCENALCNKLGVTIMRILEDYHTEKLSFAEAKVCLVEIMKDAAEIKPR